jgi:hypothetical protein
MWATRVEADAAAKRPATLAVRLGHGPHRCYGVWTLGVTAKGKPSVSWRGGGARHIPPGKFDTFQAFKTYVGVA